MNNREFIEFWRRSQNSFGANIILLEDFDTIFHGRKNVLKDSDLSFETVLNAIDGIEKESGVALFVTTNHPDKIDPALGQVQKDGTPTRPGRIDCIAEIGVMDRPGRVKLANRIFRDVAFSEEMADRFPEDMPAQFTNRCIVLAKEMLWQQKKQSNAS